MAAATVGLVREGRPLEEIWLAKFVGVTKVISCRCSRHESPPQFVSRNHEVSLRTLHRNARVPWIIDSHRCLGLQLHSPCVPSTERLPVHVILLAPLRLPRMQLWAGRATNGVIKSENAFLRHAVGNARY